MATGDTLATLVQEVQYEIGHVASPAVGQNFREHIKNRIRREYRRLYHDFEWPHLRFWTDRDTAAGQRYYDYPTGVSLETTLAVWLYWGNRWHALERGIEPDHYNDFNSDDDVRLDPALRWGPYGADQVEVWPIPSTAGSLRFVAKRPFTPLTDETDRCDLDTDLVVLHAAAELSRRADPESATILFARAAQHYATLKQRTNKGRPKINFANGPAEPRRPLHPFSYVAAVGSGSSSSDADFVSDFEAALDT